MPVTQTFTGDANQLTRELDKVNAAYAKLEQQIARASDKSEEGHRKSSAALQSALNSVIGLAAQYVSLEGAIRAVTAARERDDQIQQRAIDANLRLATAQTDLLRNAGKDFDELANRIEGISKRTRVGRASLTEAASAAISGRPEGMTMPQVASAIEAAAGMMREQPQNIAPFTQSLLQIMGATGIREGGAAAGMLQSIAGVSAIPSAVRVGEFAAPGMFTASVKDAGDPARAALQAAAMFSMFTRRGDPRGEKAGTTTVGMVSGLADFFKGREDPGSLLGRVEALQSNETLRKTFLSKPIEGVALALKTQAENLFDPKSPEFAMFKANIGAIQISPQPYKALMQRMGTATPSLAMGEQRRALEANIEEADLAEGQTRRMRARNILQAGLNRGQGIGAWGDELAGMLFYDYSTSMPRFLGGGVDPAKSAEFALRGKRASYEHGGIQPDERKAVEKLDDLISQLHRLNRTAEKGSAAALGGAATDQPSRHREN